MPPPVGPALHAAVQALEKAGVCCGPISCAAGTVTGISMGILVALFLLQSVGTQRVSFLFR